jgi:hypothetical protein
LFGSGLKFELLEARLENKRLEDKIEAKDKDADWQTLTYKRGEDAWRKDNDRFARELEATKNALSNAQAQVVELDKKNAVLLERLDILANHFPTQTTQAFNSPEELEDAEWALRNGQIDASEFEEILASAGALNAEIAFDTSAIPRIGS